MPRCLSGRPIALLGATVLGAAAATTAVAAASAEPARALVALVLDTSGSVTANGLGRARELSLGVLARLPPGSEVALFTFDDESRMIRERTSRPDEIRRALQEVRIAGHRTALYDALYDASRYLVRAPASRRAIVLVTDGRDTDSALDVDDGLRLASASGIPVFPVGIGSVNERLLRRIAKLTSGEFTRDQAASAEVIAARIAALPPAAQAEPAPAPVSPRPASPPAAPPRAAELDAPSPAKAPGLAGSRWVGLGVAALVPVAGFAFVLLRRRSRPRCPDCAAPVAAPGAECSSCRPRDRVVDADLSPTVLARLSATEEYLDKTITLRERPVLAVTRGPAMGQTFDLSLQSATSLGRAKVNDIVLPDVAVSSEHCRVRPEDGHFVLHDLKSTNGTFVNERRVTRHNLAVGDVIKIGETALQFRTEQRRAN